MAKIGHCKINSDEARQRLMRDFQNLSEEMETLLHNFFSDCRRMAPSPGHAFLPAMDVFETELEIVCLLDLVGVAPGDLKVQVDAGTLFISGVRRELPGFEKRHYHKMELDFGAFERILTLPQPVDAASLRIENLGGFYLIRLRKTYQGLRPARGILDSTDLDPRR